MVDIYQYGYGEQVWGDHGFGGYAPLFAESQYAPNDAPLIAYSNLLTVDSQGDVAVGAEVAGFPLTNAANLDNMSVTKITPSAGGLAQIRFLAPNTVYTYGFGASGFGDFGFGGYLPTPRTVSCVILGASRHSAGGARSVPSRVTIFAQDGFGQGGYALNGFGGEVVNSNKRATDVAQGSATYMFDPVPAVRVLLTLTMPNTNVLQLPEVFIGDCLRLPFVDFGYDPYHEVTYGTSFISESGREYPQVRYRRMELTPKFSNIERAKWASIDAFRENVTELRAPFWFAWSPHSLPNETYLMREDGKDFNFPIKHTNYRDLSGKFVEVI